MHYAEKIYLIGFMGSGKSTTGRRLASRLKWTFLDLDDKIEKSAGMKISNIFSEKGEDHFRELEHKALRDTENITRSVISTGGGTPCFKDNMDFMIKTGLTVYLRLTPEKLKSRLAKSSDKRPLIKDIGKDELSDYITSKLAEREKWYLKADLVTDGFDVDIKDLCAKIRALLER
ncbi:MAG: shikimate kinase [Bacteroidales bacterium]|jgi:shikimate kinase|nr:shikimate kinase [Bacteroidales bacterium]